MKQEYYLAEDAYTAHFSQKYEIAVGITYVDNILKGMYTHNFDTVTDMNMLQSHILKSLEGRKAAGVEFYRLETKVRLDQAIIDALPIKPDVTLYDFMEIDTDNYDKLNGNPNCEVKEANSPLILEDGAKADVASNEPVMGEFAHKRIERKVQIYTAPDSHISLFVCYHEEKAIGTCELMLVEGLPAKIEDFDIISDYQKKGFGTSVLKHLLKVAHDNGFKKAYLITEQDDTAKEMYQKCGFKKIGEKVEYFFKIK